MYKKYKKYKKIKLAALLVVIGTLVTAYPNQISAAEAPKENELYARSCALMDADSGRILYGKQETSPMANASTTKILTCIVTLESVEPETVATASALAAAQPKVHLGMSAGEQFLVKDLLYGLMLESYNDCAVAIAETVAESTSEFARMMNEKARRIGCKDTYFITPNGLDAEDENGFHHTTAEDLCRIMSYCAWESPKAQQFLEITQTMEHTFCNLEGKKSYTVTNKNAFLHMMDGVVSGKTGFTGNAGYCYVAALESEGRRYCIALLACGWPNNRTYKWKDASKLFRYGIDNFHYVSCEKPQSFPQIEVQNGRKENAALEDFRGRVTIVPVVKEQELLTRYLLRDGQEMEMKMILNRTISAPVSEKDIVGEIIYYADGAEIVRAPIYAGSRIERWNFKCLLKLVIQEYLL